MLKKAAIFHADVQIENSDATLHARKDSREAPLETLVNKVRNPATEARTLPCIVLPRERDVVCNVVMHVF